MKLILFFVPVLCYTSMVHAQISVEGDIQLKYYSSQQQKQQAGYRGSGYWVKGPAVNVKVCVDILDKNEQKVKELMFNTDASGHFKLTDIPAKINYFLVFRCYCENTPNYIKKMKVKENNLSDFRHMFKVPK